MSALPKLPNFIILGTDTNVGKTVGSLLLMRTLFEKGYDPFYLKPYQTGCRDIYDTDCDAKFIYENTPQLQGKDWAESVSYCLKEPKAPYFAALNEKKTVGDEKVFESLQAQSQRHHPLVIEMSGGLLVPITREMTNLDLLKQIQAVPILIARAGLGTINHTLMTLELLSLSGIKNTEVLFIDAPKDSTDPGMVRENMEAIQLFGGKTVRGMIPPISDFSHLSQKAVQPIHELLTAYS